MEENSTVKVHVTQTESGPDTIFWNATTGQLSELYWETPEGMQRKREIMVLKQKEQRLQKHNTVILPYTFALAFTLAVVLFLNVSWNLAVKNKAMKIKVWKRIFLFIGLLMLCFGYDYGTVVFSTGERPLMYIPYLIIMFSSGIKKLAKVNKEMGHDDSNIFEAVHNVVAGRFKKVQEEINKEDDI